MINELTRMASALTPPMYRYLRMYIRFLLPERDRPVEELLQFLRSSRSKDKEVLEEKLSSKYKGRRLKYLYNKLWILLEEVRMDPLQPWNEKIFESHDVLAQRKLLGGICLAMSGLAEPAHHRFIEADEAAELLSGSNPALRLQTSWFRSQAHDPRPQVQERIGTLVAEYMSAVKAKSFLFHTIQSCLIEGCPPGDDQPQNMQDLQSLEMNSLIQLTLYCLEQQQFDKMMECLKQCEKISVFYHNEDPLIYPLLLVRCGLNVRGCQLHSMKIAKKLLETGVRLLPNGHRLYPDALKTLFVCALFTEGIKEAEHVWDEHQGRMLFPTITSYTYLFEAMIAYVQNDTRSALQAIAKINTQVYNNPDVRFFELMILISREEFYTASCKLESIRKLLVRRGETTGRRREVYKMLRFLELRGFEFSTTKEKRKAEFEELRQDFQWRPSFGELIPLPIWFEAQIAKKPIISVLQQFRKSGNI
jgi:hypothetical protein